MFALWKLQPLHSACQLYSSRAAARGFASYLPQPLNAMSTAAIANGHPESLTEVVDSQKLPFSGDTSIASALKNVELERIVGPGETDFIRLGSLWQEQPVLLHFLRRFGCRLCRGGALEMSEAIPQLLKAGVRVAAVGPEPLGLEEFVQGKYWAGEIYVDDGKKAYKALQLKSLGYFNMFMKLFFDADVRKSLDKTKNVAGNFAGDGMQLGATFLFEKGGKLITGLKQETPADHFTPQQLLKFFNVEGSDPAHVSHAGPCTGTDTCEADQCS